MDDILVGRITADNSDHSSDDVVITVAAFSTIYSKSTTLFPSQTQTPKNLAFAPSNSLGTSAVCIKILKKIFQGVLGDRES